MFTIAHYLPGKDDEHEDCKKYLEHVSHNPDEHAEFLLQRERSVSLRNKDPNTTKLKGARELRTIKKVIAKKRAGRKIIKPRKQFITLEALQLHRPKAFKELKDSDIVVEEIDGKLVRGVLGLKEGEKDGFFDIEDFNERGVEEKTIADDGETLLSENQQEHRFSVLRDTTLVDPLRPRTSALFCASLREPRILNPTLMTTMTRRAWVNPRRRQSSLTSMSARLHPQGAA